MNRRKFLRGAAACAAWPAAASEREVPANVIKYGEYQVVTEPQSVDVSVLSELTSDVAYMQGRTTPNERNEHFIVDAAGNRMPGYPWV